MRERVSLLLLLEAFTEEGQRQQSGFVTLAMLTYLDGCHYGI